MEIKFENITKYNKEIYNAFLQFHTKKYFFQYIFYSIIAIILLIYMLICSITSQNWRLIVLISICIIGFILFRVLSQKVIIKKEMNSSKILNQEEFTFKFYEKYFTINTENKIEDFKYKKVVKAFETDKYFYLYINKNDAFILDKIGFIDKNSNEFKIFLKEKLKYKFKI